MSDELKNTIRFRRANQGDGDTSGSAATTEMSEFELVSTQMLEKILVAKDDAPKNRIRDLADYEDGWLARDTASKDFEIVKDDELERALKSAGKSGKPQKDAEVSYEAIGGPAEGENEDLCLVSTQHLRKVLKVEPEEKPKPKPEAPKVESRGFNPYNNG